MANINQLLAASLKAPNKKATTNNKTGQPTAGKKDTTVLRQAIIADALTQTRANVPYFEGNPQVWGVRMDCSGFMQLLFARHGIQIPRTTYDQVKAGRGVTDGNILPGDLVFARPGPNGPEHVGLFIGNGQVAEESHSGPGGGAKVVSYDSYWTGGTPRDIVGGTAAAGSIPGTGGTAPPIAGGAGSGITGGRGGKGNAPQGGDSYITTKQAAKQASQVALQSAFFQHQLASTDSILSMQLHGKRAMANDISLMEWIQDLTASSGRVFMSHPNGDFYAFYPDRFGMHGRTPYFDIAPIEMLDLTVQLNDTELVTHLFGAGPQQFMPTILLVDRILSMVASVEEDSFDVFVHSVFDDPATPAKEGMTVREFLNRYGARPLSQDFPELRHPLLLWVATWMLFLQKWSERFVANASFTFMPELFPGGRVSLAGRLDMFVESVTHTWDLTGGFTTDAELSSPARPKNPGSNAIGGDLPQAGLPSSSSNFILN